MKFFMFTILFACSFLTLEGSTQSKQNSLLLNNELRPCPESVLHDSEELLFFNVIHKKNLPAIFLSTVEGGKIAQDLVGLTENYFYAINLSNKQQTGDVYNEDIAMQILLINQNIKSFGKKAIASADFISNTLSQMNSAINQLIVDSSTNASAGVISADYAQIQAVVNAFNAGFSKILHSKKNRLACQATTASKVALQAFANNVETYISQVNLIVFQSSLGSSTLLSSNYQLIINLRKFIEMSAVATLLAIS